MKCAICEQAIEKHEVARKVRVPVPRVGLSERHAHERCIEVQREARTTKKPELR